MSNSKYQNKAYDTALWFEPTDKYGELKPDNWPKLNGLVTTPSGHTQKMVAWADFQFLPAGTVLKRDTWILPDVEKTETGKRKPMIKLKADNDYRMERERVEEQGRNVIDNPTQQPRGETGKLDQVHGNAANIEYSIDDDKDEGES